MDVIDMLQERMEREEVLNRRPPFNIKFTQGVCLDCGEHSTLVDSVCGPCRSDAERKGKQW